MRTEESMQQSPYPYLTLVILALFLGLGSTCYDDSEVWPEQDQSQRDTHSDAPIEDDLVADVDHTCPPGFVPHSEDASQCVWPFSFCDAPSPEAISDDNACLEGSMAWSNYLACIEPSPTCTDDADCALVTRSVDCPNFHLGACPTAIVQSEKADFLAAIKAGEDAFFCPWSATWETGCFITPGCAYVEAQCVDSACVTVVVTP